MGNRRGNSIGFIYLKKVRKINRNQKRTLDRKNKKNISTIEKQTQKENKAILEGKQWYKNLPLSRKMFIGWFIEQKTIQNDNIVAATMDKCFMSALDDNTDLDILTMKKIIAECNTYLEDYKNYLEKEGNEGFNMIENEELRNKVKTKTKEIMAENKDKAKGLKKLRSEFNLPQAELSDMWAECKTEGVSNPHTPKKVKEVAADKEEKKIEVVNTKVKNVDSAKMEQKPALKIVNTIQEIQGTYNTYIKSSTGVRIGDKYYNDKSIVEEERQAIERRMEAKREDLRKQIEKLSKELGDITVNQRLEFAKYEELEAVFDM